MQSLVYAGSFENHNSEFHPLILQVIMHKTLGYTFKKETLGFWNHRQTKFQKRHIFQIELSKSQGI